MNLYSTESHGLEVTQRYRREAEEARLIARAPRHRGVGRAAPLVATLAAFVRRLALVAGHPHDPRPARDDGRRPA
jgi:hypothetical protein